MAASTVVLTENKFPNGSDMTQRRFHKYGTVAISASPGTYTTGGNAFTFAAPVFDVSSQTPIDLEIKSVSGSGFIYQWNKASNTVQIFTTGTASGDALNELAAGATPAGVSGDTIVYHAQFLKSV